MGKEITPWHVAYSRIAELLYGYYVEHGSKAGQNLFHKLIEDKEFTVLNPWVRAFDEKWAREKESVDPIQLFASVFRSKAKDATRCNRINKLIQLLGDKRPDFTEIEFRGCPVLHQ